MSPATHEQAMLIQALMLSSCVGCRDRQGVGARLRAAYRCFNTAPPASTAPSLAEADSDKKSSYALPTAPSGIAAEAVDDDGDAIALRSLLGPHVTPAPSLLRQANHLRNAAGIHECHVKGTWRQAGRARAPRGSATSNRRKKRSCCS